MNYLMHITLCCLAITASIVHSCPTCIGLPRPGERPFFERKAFLSVIQKPTIPAKSTSTAPSK